MNNSHRIYVFVFLYNYLVVTYLVVSAAMFAGTFKGVVIFAVMALLGVLLIAFKWNNVSKRDIKKGIEKKCHLELLGVIAVVLFYQTVQFNELLDAKPIGVGGKLILYLLLVSIFIVAFYAEYYAQKFLLIYSNPSVSTETRKRFGRNEFFALRKMFIGCFVLFTVMFAVACAIPEVQLEPVSWEKSDKQPPEEYKKHEDSSKKSLDKAKKIKEEKEEQAPFWKFLLMLLQKIVKYLIIILLVVGVVLIIYFALRAIFSLRLPKFHRVEKNRMAEKVGIDEYIPIQTKSYSNGYFTSDNNGKVRKAFWRHVRKSADGKVDTTLTPEEMGEQYLKNKSDSFSDKADEIVSIYEKARYSGKMCSDEETDKIRNI